MSYSGLVLCEELDVTREPLKQTHIFVNNLFKIPNISHIEKVESKADFIFCPDYEACFSRSRKERKTTNKSILLFSSIIFHSSLSCLFFEHWKTKTKKKHLNCLLTKSGITRKANEKKRLVECIISSYLAHSSWTSVSTLVRLALVPFNRSMNSRAS